MSKRGILSLVVAVAVLGTGLAILKKEKANTNTIVDVWGNEVDLSKIDMILTESQLKLWKAYTSIDEYIECCYQNGYTFSITKVTPKYDRDYAYLNYQ